MRGKSASQQARSRRAGHSEPGLRNRVAGYREGDLMRHLHPESSRRERVAFEHHVPGTHILVAFPLDAWPHLLAVRNTKTPVDAGRL